MLNIFGKEMGVTRQKNMAQVHSLMRKLKKYNPMKGNTFLRVSEVSIMNINAVGP